MLYNFYQHLPQYINPIAFSVGHFAVRWYAVSYIVGFLVMYGILMWRIKHCESKNIALVSNKIQNSKSETHNILYNMHHTTLDLLLVAFFAALLGGRLGYVLFYNLEFFLAHPWAIVSPYVDGNFVGIYGMSYHGALAGAILAGWIFAHIKKLDFWIWADFVIVAVPMGYFFGRLGNFLNGELYGRVTTSPLGMYFAADPFHLRYPSQLAEAFLEGILLFVILWKIQANCWLKSFSKGSLLAVYLIGYAIVRIVGEQFREPDLQLGFLWNFCTMGQFLSLWMIFMGLAILIFQNRKKVLK